MKSVILAAVAALVVALPVYADAPMSADAFTAAMKKCGTDQTCKTNACQTQMAACGTDQGCIDAAVKAGCPKAM